MTVSVPTTGIPADVHASNGNGVACDHGQRRRVIAESLLAEIFQGRVRAGERLVIQELAARFGVSHTPIREALVTLEGVGIIDLAPNRGAVVRRVTAVDVEEICQVRRALECEAVRRACGRMELAELHELAGAFRRIKGAKAGSHRRLIDCARRLDNQLHDLIAESCANRFLAQELSRLKLLFRAFRDVSWEWKAANNDHHRFREEAREHLAIVEGLLADDARDASRAMARHIRSGVRYWSRALPPT
jgi:DNA-binding GntR family transcriptional regulator